MATMIAPKKKTKKVRTVDNVIPDLPDMSQIELNEDRIEISETLETEVQLEDTQNESEQTQDSESPLRTILECYEAPKSQLLNIERLYPSLIQSLEIQVPEESKNSLDMVTERITRPLAPVEEWHLPAPRPLEEMRTYYENELLDSLNARNLEFIRQHQQHQCDEDPSDPSHPLGELIATYLRAWKQVLVTEQRVAVNRKECARLETQLWSTAERTAMREARCRDNLLVKHSYTYEESSFNAEGARHLETALRLTRDSLLDETVLRRYEAGLARGRIDEFLGRATVAVVKTTTTTISATQEERAMVVLRRCLAVLARALRRLPVDQTSTDALRHWLLGVGTALVTAGGPLDRLGTFRELLHLPAGVAEWAGPLVGQLASTTSIQGYVDNGGRFSLAVLAMLMAESDSTRESLLSAWKPGGSGGDGTDASGGNGSSLGEDGGGWALVDSDGEDDQSMATSWLLLRESDLLCFLDHVPLVDMFRAVLDVPGGTDDYDTTRGCHPDKVLGVIAFSIQVVAILERGLNHYDNTRFKAINKRISRLIKHTVQHLTDHLEAVLATSVIPQYDRLFPGDTRLRLLAQYEAFFDSALLVLIRHRRHDNWQCLVDLPWRLLCPQRKWFCLARLIDRDHELPEQEAASATFDWWLSRLQYALEQIGPGSENDVIYLLSALANVGLEVRLAIASEMYLLDNVVRLLFQVCYVIPATRNACSKLGRTLLSSLALQHPRTLSSILDAMKLWHPTVGTMGLSLFRELPFCLLAPSDPEYRLLTSWLLDQPVSSICNQLARHVFSNLNWGFADAAETVLYLPLSLHQRMAALLVSSFKRHAIDAKASAGLVIDTIKLVTNLWWNQEAVQDQSFHAWCLGLCSRLRLHPSTRVQVTNAMCLQQSSVTNSSEWVQALADAHGERCAHPVAMYMAATTAGSSESPIDAKALKLAGALVGRHQQYRLGLELVFQTVGTALAHPARRQLLMYELGPGAPSGELFLALWRQLVHADDSFYGLVKSLMTRQFPGPVLSCIGTALAPALALGNGDKDQQQVAMQFLLRSLLAQPTWPSDASILWLLDRILQIDTALDLQIGAEEIYGAVKQCSDKQFADASKRSGFAQMFRFGTNFSPLLGQLASGDFMWLKGYVVEAQVKVEDELGLWKEVLHKLLVRKKREPRTVAAAISSAVKSLRLGLSFGVGQLALVQTAQVLAACPPESLALVRIAAVFFRRYLGLARVWHAELIGRGSIGHRLFADDACHPFLQGARAALSAASSYHAAQLVALCQSSPGNVAAIEQQRTLVERFETLLLWIDEPRLHLEEPGRAAGAGLPTEYRADLLGLARLSQLPLDALALPRRQLVETARQGASSWHTRHDLDFRFVRLATTMMCKPVIPLAIRLTQRFRRHGAGIGGAGAGTQPNQADARSTPQLPIPLMAPMAVPPLALSNSTELLEFVGAPLGPLYQAAAKHRANCNFLSDLDKRYLSALERQYEARPVTQTVQLPCHRGAAGCTGPAVITLQYSTWVRRPDAVSEAAHNRRDQRALVDEMVQFPSLDQVVRGVICVQTLIGQLESRMQIAKSKDEFQRVVDCGLALFFHLGRQINAETQKYPPHHVFVSETMETIGSKFMRYSCNQASVLLKGMIANELLVNVYGSHFYPNADTATTAAMYKEVIDAYESGKCTQDVASTIFSKFNMVQFIELSPSLPARLAMVDAIIVAISHTKSDGAADNQLNIDTKMEQMHVANLELLLSSSFSVCLPRILEGFRSLCEVGKLGSRFWTIVSRCLQTNIEQHAKELALSIDEIRIELEAFGVWLSQRRFADSKCTHHGLYVLYAPHAAPLLEIYGLLLSSLAFKLGRSAAANIVSWREVVDKGWDLFLKVYIPWIQAFSIAEKGQTHPETRLPWRIEDKTAADSVFLGAMQRLNLLMNLVANEDAQSYFMHCTLIWLTNGLLGIKELPSIPFHDTYCKQITTLKWERLKPSSDSVKLVSELVSRPWISEQCKVMSINIVSQLPWSAVPHSDTDLTSSMFNLLVVLICRTKDVFKIEFLERLADNLIDLSWDQLPAPGYRSGMEQLAANLEPRIILCNPSTIEGKVIKLLNHVAGFIPASPGDNSRCSNAAIETAITKQTVYTKTVVKLLTVAFSSTSSRMGKHKASGDEPQLKMFQLRISGLFSEMEAVAIQATNTETSNKVAVEVLSEVVPLFTNQAIAVHSIEPVIDWLQESRSSPLILPFLMTLFRNATSYMSPVVRLAEELIQTYILSEKSDGGPASWATVTACARLEPDLQQEYWKEAVKQSSLFCLLQQVLVALPSSATTAAPTDKWQTRVVEWLDQIKPVPGPISEHALVLLVFLYLQLMLATCRISSKPNASFKNCIQLLLKLSESKTSSGILGKVGLGKRSNFTFEFRMLCRSLSVFLHAQLPTNNLLRTRPNDPGALTHAEMTITSRSIGEPLPSNKTLQNLEWLKSQRLSKELSGTLKAVLETNISFICNPSHSVMDSTDFVRQMCRQLWPDSKVLKLVYY